MEKDIERKLVTAVRKLGGIAYKFVSPGNNGVPDRIVLMPGGRIDFVELKTEVGTLTKLQKMQIKRIRGLEQMVRVLYGEAEVDAYIEELAEYKDDIEKYARQLERMKQLERLEGGDAE